jgi:hypothetical protein
MVQGDARLFSRGSRRQSQRSQQRVVYDISHVSPARLDRTGQKPYRYVPVFTPNGPVQHHVALAQLLAEDAALAHVYERRSQLELGGLRKKKKKPRTLQLEGEAREVHVALPV